MAKKESKEVKSVKKVEKKPSVKKEVKENTVKEVVSKPDVEKVKETKVVQEENHYGRTLLAAILIIVIFVGGYLAIQLGKNKEEYKPTEDEVRFKEEYEKLNGTTRANGHKNKDVSIIADNNVEYIDIAKAAEILDSGSGVIYFGFSSCPWCRNAVPVLLNAMDSSSLDKIYYVDVRANDDAANDIRDEYVLNDRNKAVKLRDADESYYVTLMMLANYLSDYVLYTEDGKEVNTGEKRLMAPSVVAVVDGVVVDFHEGTVKGHVKDENGDLPDLTEDEKIELLNEYSSLISKYLNNDCPQNSGGC